MAALSVSAEAQDALAKAATLAAAERCPPNSLHLLRALCRGDSAAGGVLARFAITAARLDSLIAADGGGSEPKIVFGRLQERAQEVADNARAPSLDCLHLLLALLRLREARAYGLLANTSHALPELRAAAVAAMASEEDSRPEPALRAPARARQQSLGGAPPPVPNPPPRLSERSGEGSGHAPRAAAPAPGGGAEAPCRRPVSKRAAGRSRGMRRRGEPRPERPTAGGPRRPAALPPLATLAPTLAECATCLTARAERGELEPAIGRHAEQEALADVLGKRRANNPVLIGPPGVGKTAIVEGLALLWHEGRVEGSMAPRRLVALDTLALVAGTSLRGAFSERFLAIKQEVAAARGQVVVFIDELHLLIGAGAAGEGPQDAANELKTALARGEFPCIGATTEDEFKRHIERDPALERRFSPIAVSEPSTELALRIVQGALAPYEAHHGVTYAPEAVVAAVELSHRFVTERKLPDKAFAALDLAGSRAARRKQREVVGRDVAEVVHEWTEVPLARLLEAEASRFARAEAHLGEHLVGHREPIEAAARALRRGFAGFNRARPMGSFLLLGPTGVGKTEFARALATFVFGHRDALVRIDMSELGEKHAVARLLGAQPGYVGYEEGGQLTEALRKRPFQIVLFDEVEKAHADVLHVLLQLLDEGHLTDAQGRRISFAHTLVILTSNLGAGAVETGSAIGFAGSGQAGSQASGEDRRRRAVLAAAKGRLPAELWSRLDEHLVFLPLTRNEIALVASRQLAAQAKRLLAERRVTLTWTEDTLEFLLRDAESQCAMGARGLRQAIARHVEAPLAEALFAGELTHGVAAHLVPGGAGLALELPARERVAGSDSRSD